jgi:hypothetical protein
MASGLVSESGKRIGSKPMARSFAAVRLAPGSGRVTSTRT